ncbi:hypothetical protein MM213_05225 [Belliella sp. R4-6]|uniref:Membrane-bound lysozyme-inhibitor of c-type lysozyme n=1 Tax=Belliella alkalica TaxID=1730871 RepID=A0ABS9V8Z8_9BACT|nr:hypothetical protein [Belliella alkalica]MCH7412878.1 hypothetical protein [Belliella alkalica]
MKKSIWVITFVLFFSLSCSEFEEIGGSCTVYLVETDDSGAQLSYVIDQDLRRNKKTGVFTYRVFNEDGTSKLWSISRASEPEEDGAYSYFSKSQDGDEKKVEFIECGGKEYLRRDNGGED